MAVRSPAPPNRPTTGCGDAVYFAANRKDLNSVFHSCESVSTTMKKLLALLSVFCCVSIFAAVTEKVSAARLSAFQEQTGEQRL